MLPEDITDIPENKPRRSGVRVRRVPGDQVDISVRMFLSQLSP
jgi:hypothetical protein